MRSTMLSASRIASERCHAWWPERFAVNCRPAIASMPTASINTVIMTSTIVKPR
jgi:hypothetical protein